MRLLARAPVRWPSPEQFDLWWNRNVAYAAGQMSVDDRGFLRDEQQTSPLRLVEGRFAQPGSRYVLEQPGLTAELEGRIDEPQRRLRLTYRPPRRGLDRLRRREFVLDLDALDLLRSMTLGGEDPYVRAEGLLRPLDPVALDLQVRLRWLRVHYVIRCEPAADGREDLVLDLEVVARHAWRLPAAPILALLRRLGRGEWQTVADEMSASIEAITDGTSQPGQFSPGLLRNVDINLASIDLRVSTLLDELDTRSWWRRTGRALRTAHARLPVTGLRPWEYHPGPHELETAIVHSISRHRHGRRRDLLAEELVARRRLIDSWVVAIEESVAAAAARHPAELTDAVLDWSWLASPISVIGWLRAQGISDAALAPGPGASADGADADPGPQ